MNEKLFNEILENHKSCSECASPKEVELWFNSLLSFLFPDLAIDKFKNLEEVENRYILLESELISIFNSLS